MSIHPETRARQVMITLGEPPSMQTKTPSDPAGPAAPLTRGRITPSQTLWQRPPNMTDLEWALATHRAAYAHPASPYPQPADLDAARRIADMLMKDVE